MPSSIKTASSGVSLLAADRESANAANDKVLEFVQESLPDLNLGAPEIIAGEVLVSIESDE
ncbi:MAG TPA: hypothetical protein VFH89_12745 [Sphingomicrobium sp.]|nr:hypothetical protein [Sphingomicrobium sp.]